MSHWIHGGIKTSTTPGTPVRLTTEDLFVHAIMIQALPLNAKRVVLGERELNDDGSVHKTFLAGDDSTNPSGHCLAIIGKPAGVNETPPSIEYGVQNSPAGPVASQFWIDVVTSGDGVLWSYSRS